jgi:hypothetical protein
MFLVAKVELLEGITLLKVVIFLLPPTPELP